MDLTVVIVNYNVEHFLEQCLLSVEQALNGLQAEVFVVDNNSVDRSCAMVAEKFPWVTLIANRDNVGFSKANNQAMRVARGQYVLLLNPDTIVEEDTFRNTVAFMNEHPEAGGLGVRMVDGKGRFLPESKRGLPSPWVAFCKISGIYRIFRSSRRFNHYYMGYLNEHEINEVEILSGAFMLMRKETLDNVGLLDETFFMYGEDIDLSWRIIQGGYRNYYYPKTTIIHYKGESTKKGSLNYVFVFYQAMVIFARKHFSERNARLFTSLINLAIYARAALAVAQRFLNRVWLPLLDFGALTGGLWVIAKCYGQLQEKIYEPALLIRSFTAFSVVWLISVLFTGGYDRPLSAVRMIKGSIAGSVLILLSYSLLPEELRFSRAIVLSGALWSLAFFPLSRMFFSVLLPRTFDWVSQRERRYAVAASPDELSRITELIRQTQGGTPEVIHLEVAPNIEAAVLARRLEDTIRVYRVDVVIFSAKDLSSAAIIELMGGTTATGVDYKIAPPDSLFMIGSNSIDTSGDLFMLQTNAIHKAENRRAKRLFDVVTAGAIIGGFLLFAWCITQKTGALRNAGMVLLGKASWVGYDRASGQTEGLPRVRPSVLTTTDGLEAATINSDTASRLNLIYARDYRVTTDLRILLNGFRRIGKVISK